ncbi:gustatory receptor for sugar taste 64f-like [Phlebotomus argentipes]|uniref:gustatory receptor for sugar taste 64f-like n=1 Tax=Phlebotomus argentipes TaxID=94469 RepID=UPI00289332FB|nr:gustatory receptor for sugar taste 64f-like [Phlebotomus argentipes]
MGQNLWISKDFLAYRGGHNGSTFRALRPVFTVARIFSLLPVGGVFGDSLMDLQFKWFTLGILYSLIVITFVGFMTIIAALKFLEESLTFNNIVSVFFYLYNFSAIVILVSIARKWPELMVYWHTVEKNLPQTEHLCGRRSLRTRLHQLVTSVLLLAAVEHGLSIAATIEKSHRCLKFHSTYLEHYFRESLPHLFMIFNYHPLLGWFGYLINFYCTFVWNFMDLFIIAISIALATRFKQVNAKIEQARGKIMSDLFWNTQRNHYQQVSTLVQEVDNVISSLIFLSYLNNLYFVCVQLLHSLNPMEDYIQIIYFWYSLIFLILRTFGVSLYSSKIHDQSKRPAEVIRSVPTPGLSRETKRFLEEVTNEHVALTGKKFFRLTRKLILKITGTIVTYELVLIQVSPGGKVTTDHAGNPNLCR